MWVTWLIPSLVAAGALLATAVAGLEAWRRYRALRSRVDALAADARAAAAVLDPVRDAAPARASVRPH
jgi:hypothetical protein